MSNNRDRKLIGLLVEREVEGRMSWTAFSQRANVSRATLYRVKEGDPKVTDRTFRRIEKALGLPFDSLSSVGAHDFDVLQQMGMERGLVTWLMHEARKSSPAKGVPHT